MSHEPKRILVPTDFSAASKHAVSIGTTLAKRFNAEIHPLHVRRLHRDPNGLLDDPAGEQSLLDEVEQVLQATDLKVQEALGELEDRHNGVRYVGHIERGVSVPNTILESVAAYGCDLIVMGTHGRRAVSHLLMGSVTERVVRLSPVPVMTTRDDGGGSFPPGRILVGYDSSRDSVEALRFAGAWARSLDSKLVLIHVVEPLIYPEFYAYPTRNEFDERIIQHSHQALRLASSEHVPDIEVETQVVQGRTADSIVEFAASHDCDLVVLATHGLSGVAHALLGSVAERVVRTADVPVLTVRTRAYSTGSRRD